MIVPYETQRSVVSDKALVLIVYGLYAIGYFTAISALVGVAIAHVKIRDADLVLQSHFHFQIRTFWIGLLYIAIGVPLCLVLIGIPVLVWGFVWSVVRVTRGFMAMNEMKPIANPRSWLFG